MEIWKLQQLVQFRRGLSTSVHVTILNWQGTFSLTVLWIKGNKNILYVEASPNYPALLVWDHRAKVSTTTYYKSVKMLVC